MKDRPTRLTYEIELQPGEKMQLPESLTAQVGPGRWRLTVQPLRQPPIRDHAGFLKSYSAEDDFFANLQFLMCNLHFAISRWAIHLGALFVRRGRKMQIENCKLKIANRPSVERSRPSHGVPYIKTSILRHTSAFVRTTAPSTPPARPTSVTVMRMFSDWSAGPGRG